jgi:hypothetical protein
MNATTTATVSIPLLAQTRRPAQSFVRIVLVGTELHALHAPYRTVRVLTGTAYVSHRGCDIVLGEGQARAFDVTSESALISPLGHKPLVVELSA